MNWVENLIGWSPDNGSGAAELLIAFGVLALLALSLRHVRRRGA